MKNSFAFSDDVVGVLIDSEFNEEKVEQIKTLLEEKIQTGSPVSVYLEDECKQGITFLGYLKSLSFHLANPDAVRKVAIVTDLKWFRKSMEVKDLLIKSDLRTFDTKQRLEAMNWVME